MTYQFILLEKDRDRRIAVITLNRPEKVNALSAGLRDELHDALRDCDTDPEVHAIVLTGAGRAFSGGADMGGGDGNRRPTMADNIVGGRGGQNTRFFRDMTKPIIAAVNGWCLGAGLELANTCDFIIASEQAQFGAPEIRHGSTLNTIMPWNLGPQWARYLLLSSETIDAQTAERIGLALKVVPHDQLMAEATTFAHTLAKIPPMAMQLNKRMIDGIMNIAGMSAGLEYGAAISAICLALAKEATTPDGRNLAEIRDKEGIKAFLDARDAPFREIDLAQRKRY